MEFHEGSIFTDTTEILESGQLTSIARLKRACSELGVGEISVFITPEGEVVDSLDHEKRESFLQVTFGLHYPYDGLRVKQLAADDHKNDDIERAASPLLTRTRLIDRSGNRVDDITIKGRGAETLSVVELLKKRAADLVEMHRQRESQDRYNRGLDRAARARKNAQDIGEFFGIPSK